MLWESIKKSVNNPAWIRKAVAALVLSALLAVAKGQLPDAVGIWINIAQPILLFLGVWAVPNSDDKETGYGSGV
jgi:hypothetical protein